MRALYALAAVLLAGGPLLAQPPDGRAILRGAGVDVPRGGPEAAFDAGMTAPAPVPPGAVSALIVGMGPVAEGPRIRNAYAFAVLAGRSARTVRANELAGASVALLNMMVADSKRTRIAGVRVAGYVFAAPIDGGPEPARPSGLLEAVVLLLNSPDEQEQVAAMEAIGLLRETAAVPMLREIYARQRAGNNRAAAGVALEALTRIGDPQTAALVRELASDPWGDRDDPTGLIVAFARERFLKDGSARRLESAASNKTLGPRARAYLAELGFPLP